MPNIHKSFFVISNWFFIGLKTNHSRLKNIYHRLTSIEWFLWLEITLTIHPFCFSLINERTKKKKTRCRLHCQSLSLYRLTSLVDFIYCCLYLIRRLFMVLNSLEMTNPDEDSHWLHSDTDLISGPGVVYNVNVIRFLYLLLLIKLSFFSFLKYLGSVEVLCSMKTLDFDNRTRVARDSIRLVCSAVGVHLRERHKVNNNIFWLIKFWIFDYSSPLARSIVSDPSDDCYPS